MTPQDCREQDTSVWLEVVENKVWECWGIVGRVSNGTADCGETSKHTQLRGRRFHFYVQARQLTCKSRVICMFYISLKLATLDVPTTIRQFPVLAHLYNALPTHISFSVLSAITVAVPDTFCFGPCRSKTTPNDTSFTRIAAVHCLCVVIFWVWARAARCHNSLTAAFILQLFLKNVPNLSNNNHSKEKRTRPEYSGVH